MVAFSAKDGRSMICDLAVLGSVSFKGKIHLATQANTRLKASIAEMGLMAPS